MRIDTAVFKKQKDSEWEDCLLITERIADHLMIVIDRHGNVISDVYDVERIVKINIEVPQYFCK